MLPSDTTTRVGYSARLLSASRRWSSGSHMGPLVGPEPVENGRRSDRIGPKGRPDLTDHDFLAAVPDTPLLPGR